MTADKYPAPPSDPSAAWELRRAAWLTPRASTSSSSSELQMNDTDDLQPTPSVPPPPSRDPTFQARLKLLEQMLTIGDDNELIYTRAGPEGAGLDRSPGETTMASERESDWKGSVNISVKGKEKASGSQLLADELAEPDGGAVIGQRRVVGRERSRSGEKVLNGSAAITPVQTPQRGTTPIPCSATSKEELEKAIEGILAAFKQGRALKEPIPLSLVTKLLYRQWRVDGTIPLDYIPTPSTPSPPSLSTVNVEASSGPTVSTSLGPPALPITIGKAIVNGIVRSESGPKLKIGSLSGGSGWREEKEVESGSDVM